VAQKAGWEMQPIMPSIKKAKLNTNIRLKVVLKIKLNNELFIQGNTLSQNFDKSNEALNLALGTRPKKHTEVITKKQQD